MCSDCRKCVCKNETGHQYKCGPNSFSCNENNCAHYLSNWLIETNKMSKRQEQILYRPYTFFLNGLFSLFDHMF